MFDVVVLAMLAVLPVLAWGFPRRRKGQYQRHKITQSILAGAILVALILFEGDVQVAKLSGTSWINRRRSRLYWKDVDRTAADGSI